LALSVEFPFQFHYVGAPPQLALPVEIGRSQFHYVGAPPQLALPVEFHFEILYVGAPDFN
ncbi:hypothetical protein V687_02678, partial [Staphylococcus aureus H64570]